MKKFLTFILTLAICSCSSPSAEEQLIEVFNKKEEYSGIEPTSVLELAEN
jgi:hypothetical protein